MNSIRIPPKQNLFNGENYSCHQRWVEPKGLVEDVLIIGLKELPSPLNWQPLDSTPPPLLSIGWILIKVIAHWPADSSVATGTFIFINMHRQDSGGWWMCRVLKVHDYNSSCRESWVLEQWMAINSQSTLHVIWSARAQVQIILI